MKLNFWLLKVEKLLHTEDTSLKKESGKHKKKWYFEGKIDIRYLEKCIKSGFVSTAGNLISKFENKIKNYTKSKNVIATINGTSAIHVTLRALEIKKNDEILMPSLNFVASAYATNYLGCIPHFVDVDKNTLGIDPIKLNKYLQEICFKTRS